MKLIIFITAYNEAKTLPQTLTALPKRLKGIDDIIVYVINDGSTDQTVKVARKYGAKVYSLPHHCGYGTAYRAGLLKAISQGADIIVSTDADNQYCAKDIATLIQPILNKKADIVVGARSFFKITHWSFLKKCLQKIGTIIVRFLSDTNVADATCGFRAFTRDAACRLTLFENFSPSQEILMQVCDKKLLLTSVPIRVNPTLRDSKLMKNMFQFCARQAFIISKKFLIYRPFLFFIGITFIFGVLNFLFFVHQDASYIFLLLLQFIWFLFLIYLINFNRKASEEILFAIKRNHFDSKIK